jgi:hypothetical protein
MSAERRIVRVEGHEAFKAHVEEWSKEKKGNLFVYFSGSKDPETGKYFSVILNFLLRCL